MTFSSFPLKSSLLLLCLAVSACAPATSIQDLGWKQQSSLSTPPAAEGQQGQPPQNPYDAMFPQQGAGQNGFQASFGTPREGQGADYAGAAQPISQGQAIPFDPNKTRVALLVPLSGPHAALGQAMANAAQLAVFDMGVNDFELLPRDTKGTPHGAQKAARDALASGAQLVVGPLFAANVSAVKPIISSSTVNMLGLSTDMSLAGPRTYMLGFAPGPQIDRLIDYASDRGIKRYAAMIPPGPYGQLVYKAFKKAIERTGGTIIAEDMRGDVAPIAANKEYIDALFIPYGGKALRQLVGKLETAGVTAGDMQLLGTGLWDAPNIAGGKDLLIGGWYAAPEPELHANFIDGYRASFGKVPPRLATLSYDAIAMAAVLTRHGMGYDEKALQLRTGFAGVDGLFRLEANGHIERGLAINEIMSEGSQVIDPSPRTFVKK